jgi:hypothetical protein
LEKLLSLVISKVTYFVPVYNIQTPIITITRGDMHGLADHPFTVTTEKMYD